MVLYNKPTANIMLKLRKTKNFTGLTKMRNKTNVFILSILFQSNTMFEVLSELMEEKEQRNSATRILFL